MHCLPHLDHPFKKLRSHLSRLARDTAGSVAVIASLSFIGVGVCLGAAIDYARVTHVRMVLQGAADAGALAAAANPAYTDKDVLRVAGGYLKNNDVAVQDFGVTVTIGHNNNGLGGSAVTVQAAAKMPTSFLRLGGINTVDVGAAATASSGSKAAEIYVALDMSESMNIAADPAARAALINATANLTKNKLGCEFACHFSDKGLIPSGAIIHDTAVKLGIPLRIDNLTQAYDGFVDNVFAAASASGSKVSAKIAVVGFSDKARLLQAATDKVADLKAAPSAFPNNERLNTHFEVVLPAIRDLMGAQGTGASNAPIKTLVLITDGLNWDRWDGTGGEVMNQADCDIYKKDGINVVVVDIKYQDATGEYWFDSYIKNLYPGISPALAQCASPGMYFEVADSDITSLNAGFDQVLKSFQQKVILTQ